MTPWPRPAPGRAASRTSPRSESAVKAAGGGRCCPAAEPSSRASVLCRGRASSPWRVPFQAAEVDRQAASGSRVGDDTDETVPTKGLPLSEYTLPDLDYDYGALAPSISGQIMELDHSKHHDTYVKGANTPLE